MSYVYTVSPALMGTLAYRSQLLAFQSFAAYHPVLCSGPSCVSLYQSCEVALHSLIATCPPAVRASFPPSPLPDCA